MQAEGPLDLKPVTLSSLDAFQRRSGPAAGALGENAINQKARTYGSQHYSDELKEHERDCGGRGSYYDVNGLEAIMRFRNPNIRRKAPNAPAIAHLAARDARKISFADSPAAMRA